MPEGPAQQQPRRYTGWKVFGIVVAGLVILLLITWVWMAMVADRRLMTLIQKVQKRVDELQARDGKRPVLRGEPQPGNAWDDYTKGIAALKPVKGANNLGIYLRKDNTGDPAEGERLVREHGAVLEHLRTGASRDSCRSYDWNQSMEGDLMQRSGYSLTTTTGSVNLAYFAQLAARILLKEGKVRECIELLLDLCQFGRDISAEGGYSRDAIGRAYVEMAFRELRPALASDKASRAEFDLVDRALAALDTSSPGYDHILQQEALTRGIEAIPVCESGIAPARLLGLHSIESQMDWAETVAKADRESWAAVQKSCWEFVEEAERSRNPFLRISGPSLFSTNYQPRYTRARLRLLRVEAHWRSSGEVLDLEDPCGGRLKHSKSDAGLKVWSVGVDGKDDGGSGEWDKVGKDIVLEIGR